MSKYKELFTLSTPIGRLDYFKQLLILILIYAVIGFPLYFLINLSSNTPLKDIIGFSCVLLMLILTIILLIVIFILDSRRWLDITTNKKIAIVLASISIIFSIVPVTRIVARLISLVLLFYPGNLTKNKK